MAEQKLIQRLNFKGDDVLLDGEVVFSVPHRDCVSEINILGVLERKYRSDIYVGCGNCCHGPIMILSEHSGEDEEPQIRFDDIRVPDFNVYDIIPARVDYHQAGFPNTQAILATGFGCSGAGVKLISAISPKDIEVVSEKELRQMMFKRRPVRPELRVNEEEGVIDLYFQGPGYMLFKDDGRRKDLTPILREMGVDIEKTIELNRDYDRIIR